MARRLVCRARPQNCAAHWLAAAVIALATAPLGFAADVVQVGLGSYTTVLPPKAKEPPAKYFAVEGFQPPMPTNRWWSSLAWKDFSDAQFPHPLAVLATKQGLQIAYPHLAASKNTIFGSMPAQHEDLVLGHSAQSQFPDARVEKYSDWFVTAAFASGAQQLSVTYGHGSPFVYADYAGGSALITSGKAIQIWSGSAQTAVLGITVNGHAYGLFGPSGSTWTIVDEKTLRNNSPDKHYFSLAVLPEQSEKTLALFQKYAYTHVADSRVEWSYEPQGSLVRTTYRVRGIPREGTETGVLMALYPHQWRNTKNTLLDLHYNSVRGEMKLCAGAEFTTTLTFPGVLPSLPVSKEIDRAQLTRYLSEEAAEKTPGLKDTYWDGKYLGKLATLIPIAEQAGDAAAEQTFRDRLRTRLEGWLSAEPRQTDKKATGEFYFNRNWDTLIGYPASYGSDQQLNDHHFHYGYFIRAAAEIARRDPAWAKPDHWGGMVDLLIDDIASGERPAAEHSAEPKFPFLRCFDVYAGHSWASGHALFGDGNNNESSSEAMNAWCGLILWGQATGNRALRDRGIYLFTTELSAINAYWFDVRHENRPPEFEPVTAAMIWGGKTDYATWFSASPEAIHAINWLPIHGGSLYLGLYPDYVEKNYDYLARRKKLDPNSATWHDWSDMIWMYRALSNPRDALRQFDAQAASFKPEAGNSKANTYLWLHTLANFGQVDRSITCDQPLYAVFNQQGKHTYVVYNMDAQDRTATFSDGTKVDAPPGQFAIRTK